MKIAVFGVDRERVESIIKRFEQRLVTEAVKPKVGTEHPIVEMAKETYGQNKRKNVVYDGCVLQYFTPDIKDEDLFDVYEQIVLTSLVNVDYVVVVPTGMSKELIEFYYSYNEMVGDKIRFISVPDDIMI